MPADSSRITGHGVGGAEGRDGTPRVARDGAGLIRIGQGEARHAKVSAKPGPVEAAPAGDQDEDVVVRATAHDDRAQQGPHVDALERRALGGAVGTLGANHSMRNAGLGKGEKRRGAGVHERAW